MPLALCIATALVSSAMISEDIVPEAVAQEVEEPATFEEVPACDVELDAVGDKTRPTVPRLVVPRLPVPRPAMPRPAVFKVEFAVVVELSELEEGEDDDGALAVDVAVGVELAAFMTPELVTELQGAGVPAAAKSTDTPETVKFVEGLMPPPSKVGNGVVPGLPVEQGAGLTVPE